MGLNGIIVELLELYVIVIVLYVVMTWFPVTNPGGPMDRLRFFLTRLSEPVLNPIRRLIPSVGGSSIRFDFAPLIVILVIELILIPIVSRI
ncbi:YggT family protein [Ferrimicrobium acidiphilum]|jgi:YggT family protein|uniref:YGGT family protein n=1 Tax=Ferrimicrobium acidiphilum DSM 19497 TaxID=1121877 RepID=A0A0D8FU24_9ACTN|nr:YggT family protein [Ferrimicrobium acidiphilum]KJE76636.1 YGGT family protein [Ferrimicrobium acidiphilum DSM 19497]MCL5053443.1 YggT family protein [Gammaproteobacteria bacterium]